MLKKHWKLVGIMVMVVAGLALCIGAVANKQVAEQAKTLSVDQVPAAVKATILEQAGTGTVKEIELETEDGQVIYEAEVVIDGQEKDVKVAADGTVLSQKVDDDDEEDEADDDEGDDDDDDDDEDEDD